MRARAKAAIVGAVAMTFAMTSVAFAVDDIRSDDGAIDNAEATHGHHSGD